MNIMSEKIETLITGYDALQFLYSISIIDDEEKAVHEHNLLFQTVEYFRQEPQNCLD